MNLSIVMPVLDEASGLPAALMALQPLRDAGVELVIADGGSRDGSAALAEPLADRVLAAPRGRARQMNAGAAAARGEVLLFLHADTRLAEGAVAAIESALARGAGWGRFDVFIDGRPAVLPLVAALMNRRSRWSGIATGDQAIFVTRAAFDSVGGFPDQPLMEDVEISRRLKARVGAPACLRLRVRTSGRRWEQRGPWRTIALMWWLRWRYWRGAPPTALADAYRR
jgi:rSAM/selenodomain-associated transferase 2